MTQVSVRSLPNGKVPTAEVRDSTVRDALMRMVENQVSTGERTRTLEKAMIEVQKRPAGGGGGGGGGDAERWARIAQAAAESASGSASSASSSASSASQAKGDAVTAKNDAVAAKDLAVAAKEAAEAAARSASGSVKVKEFAITVNVAAGSTGAYSAYVDPDAEIGTDRVPVLAVCAYSGYQKLCVTRCELSYSVTGRWSVGINVYNPDSASHSGSAKIKVLYLPAS